MLSFKSFKINRLFCNYKTFPEIWERTNLLLYYTNLFSGFGFDMINFNDKLNKQTVITRSSLKKRFSIGVFCFY